MQEYLDSWSSCENKSFIIIWIEALSVHCVFQRLTVFFCLEITKGAIGEISGVLIIDLDGTAVGRDGRCIIADLKWVVPLFFKLFVCFDNCASGFRHIIVIWLVRSATSFKYYYSFYSLSPLIYSNLQSSRSKLKKTLAFHIKWTYLLKSNLI